MTPAFSRRQLAVFFVASTVTGCAAQSTQMLDPRADRSGYGMGLDARDFTNAAQD